MNSRNWDNMFGIFKELWFSRDTGPYHWNHHGDWRPMGDFFFHFQYFFVIAYRTAYFTGSTIRNWDKVKPWLDQIFWQIYQKLMSSGFLSSGSLCLIHYFNFFWPHAALTASDRKGAKIQHEFSWFCQKKFFFQNIKIK